MDIDIRDIIQACFPSIIALIFLEIVWNSVGYSIASLCWLIKLLLLAFAGFRYYNITSRRPPPRLTRGPTAILDNPRDEDAEEKTYTL